MKIRFPNMPVTRSLGLFLLNRIPFNFREVLQTVRMPQLRYPYTLGAMLRQFPLKYHMDKSWIYKVSNIELLLMFLGGHRKLL